jgi:hypothetical protein
MGGVDWLSVLLWSVPAEAVVDGVGDSYDNALSETINGLYKAEVIHPSARALALARDGRVRHARVGRLVQQAQASRADRQHPAGRGSARAVDDAGCDRAPQRIHRKPNFIPSLSCQLTMRRENGADQYRLLPVAHGRQQSELQRAGGTLLVLTGTGRLMRA